MVRNMGQMMDLHEDSPYKTLAVRKSHHLMLHSVVFLSIFLSLQAMSCDDVKYLRHAAAWQLADIAVLSIFVLPARAFFFFFSTDHGQSKSSSGGSTGLPPFILQS